MPRPLPRLLLGLVLSVTVLAGCAPAEPKHPTGSEVVPGPAAEQPADLDTSYLQAAAFGAGASPSFDVYYPAFLPEGFTLTEAKWVAPESARGGTPGLYVTYEQDARRIGVGVAAGDIGQAEPLATLPWGAAGDVPVYRDAWKDSFIAILPSASEYTPVVRAVGVTMGELTAVLGAMTRVAP